MLPLAADWSTISSLATGLGTLVLAVATFASVRSANRSARVAEEALLEQRRPVLTPSRLEDSVQKIMFVEGNWVAAGGGRGAVQHDDGTIFLALSLRNVGAGIGVCQGWAARAGMHTSRTSPTHIPEDEFRLQIRDLYIPAGDIGMWQGAIRDHAHTDYQALAEAIESREPITLELLYSDQVGEQRTITRFGLTPYENRDGELEWLASINRHWYLDRVGPRSDDQIAAAMEAVRQDRATREAEAAELEAAALEASPSDEANQPESAAMSENGPAQPNGAARPQADDAEAVSVVPRPNCE